MPKDWQRAVEKCHCRCDDEGRDVNALWGFGRYAKAVAIIVDDRTTAFFAAYRSTLCVNCTVYNGSLA